MKSLFSQSLSRKKLALAFTSFIVVAAVGILINVGTKKTVALTLNGKQKVIRTHADTVREVLDEQHVVIHSKDYLFPTANTQVKNNLKIAWNQARQVDIVRDNEEKTVWTTANTVAEFLKEQNIAFNDHDQITPEPGKAIKDKMKVYYKKAAYLTLIDGGNKTKVWSTSTSVADFLKQQGIKLNKLDRVVPSLTKAIKETDVVNVIRVEKVTDVVEEPIQFAVTTISDGNLKSGTQRTIAEGVQGISDKYFEVTLENGKEVSKKLINQEMVRAEKDKVVAVGKKELSSQTSRGDSSSGSEFYVNATAYTASCNGCSGSTATGLNLNDNPDAKVIAVDPQIIPLGARVYVDGYGYAVAADTGSGIKGYRIDVFISSTADAFRWGQRKVKIKVLN